MMESLTESVRALLRRPGAADPRAPGRGRDGDAGACAVCDVRAAVLRSYAKLVGATDSPRLEAEVLAAHVLGATRTALLARPERAVTRRELAQLGRLVDRRAAGYPLPYLTGRAEFYGLEFNVSPEVFIPRPETELLVDLAISRRPRSVVDVGTGSGCIAVAIAVNLPEARVIAVDISPAAMAVARSNVERHCVGNRVLLVNGDVLSPRPGPVDLIVSNPPYVASGERSALPVSVREHEPPLALDGGSDGLDAVRLLLGQAPAVLAPGGALLIEIGAEQGQAAAHLARTLSPRATVRIHRDLAGRDRVLEVQS